MWVNEWIRPCFFDRLYTISCESFVADRMGLDSCHLCTSTDSILIKAHPHYKSEREPRSKIATTQKHWEERYMYKTPRCRCAHMHKKRDHNSDAKLNHAVAKHNACENSFITAFLLLYTLSLSVLGLLASAIHGLICFSFNDVGPIASLIHILGLLAHTCIWPDGAFVQ